MKHMNLADVLAMMDDPTVGPVCDCYFFVGSIRVEVEYDDDEDEQWRGWWYTLYTPGNYDADAKLDADGPYQWVDAVDEGIYSARRHDGARLVN